MASVLTCTALLVLPAVASAAAPPPSLADLPPPPYADLPTVEPEPSTPTTPPVAEPTPAPTPKPEAARPEPKPKPALESKSAPTPTPTPKPKSKAPPKPKWIAHEILPGERLDDIADRYEVSRASMIRWNKLDAKRPQLYAGRTLKVYTRARPPDRTHVLHRIKRGETWRGVASKYGVEETTLRRWNHRAPKGFVVGTTLDVWVGKGRAAAAPEPPKAAPKPRAPSTTKLAPPPEEPPESVETPAPSKRSARSSKRKSKPVAVPKVRGTAMSVGKPNRGRLQRGVKLPDRPKLYDLRRPDEAYGSSHAVRLLLSAIAQFHAEADYDRPLSIGSMSKQGGGKLRPHSSHQSGRDVDIRLPVANRKAKLHYVPKKASEIDWAAAWQLVKAMLDTDDVEYIFLDHARQRRLYREAKKDGATKAELERWFQYPNAPRTNNGIIRHSPGHGSHIHVRFGCGKRELRCESY